MKKRNVILVIIIGLIIVSGAVGIILYDKGIIFPKTSVAQTSQTKEITYKGHNRVTALTLLQQTNKVVISGTSEMAFVTSINGVKADSTKKQYWAFLVNGKDATVGAGSYITKDGDTITWKLGTY